jgi:folate-binding protein YgfZ
MLPAPKFFAPLPSPFVIQVMGADAAKVVNNLCTNDLAKLPVGGAFESFVTDVRGWVVAHASVIKQVDCVWLLGTHASPSAIANHIDRYIIREDAVVRDVSSTHALFVIGNEPDEAGNAATVAGSGEALPPTVAHALSEPTGIFTLHCPLSVLGPTSQLFCCPREQVDLAIAALRASGAELCSPEQFEWLRISNFWPLHPADISDKTIPQELDRDRQAISFTKGCYLGQETIARLDARGQLQKKLSLVELASDGQYNLGDTFSNGDKEVGHITSLACDPASKVVRALAILRRGNFAGWHPPHVQRL